MALRQALKHEQRRLEFGDGDNIDTDDDHARKPGEKVIDMATGRPKPKAGVGVATSMKKPREEAKEELRDYTEFEGLEGAIEELVMEIAEDRAEMSRLTAKLNGPDGKSGKVRELTDLLLRAGCKTCNCLGQRTTQISGEHVQLDTHLLLAAGVKAEQIEKGKKRTPWTSVKITPLEKDED